MIKKKEKKGEKTPISFSTAFLLHQFKVDIFKDRDIFTEISA